jgi:hypothetical protein
MDPDLQRRLCAAAARGLAHVRSELRTGAGEPIRPWASVEHPSPEEDPMPFTPPEKPGPVRAKMYVRAVELQQGTVAVKLAAVTRGEDNKEWAAYTPWGTLELGIKNDLASDNFAPGQEWFVTLTPVPPEQVGQEGMGG